MVIEYRLGEGDPEVEIDRTHTPIRMIFDPRLTILQIRRSMIEKLTHAEYDDFIHTPVVPLVYALEPSLLSLVS